MKHELVFILGSCSDVFFIGFGLIATLRVNGKILIHIILSVRKKLLFQEYAEKFAGLIFSEKYGTK